MSKRTYPRAFQFLKGLALISRRSLLPAALLCAALILPSNAQAKCAQWDLGRLTNQVWGILQSNGYIVGFNIKQHGNVLSGSADWRELEDYKKKMGGVLTGEVLGNVVRIRELPLPHGCSPRRSQQ